MGIPPEPRVGRVGHQIRECVNPARAASPEGLCPGKPPFDEVNREPDEQRQQPEEARRHRHRARMHERDDGGAIEANSRPG